MARKRVLALALRLLDIGFFRVGWDRYARDHGHVGLTTLRRDQVQLLELAVRLDYVAKAGKRRRMTVRDAHAVSALEPLKRRRSGPPELLAYRRRCEPGAAARQAGARFRAAAGRWSWQLGLLTVA